MRPKVIDDSGRSYQDLLSSIFSENIKEYDPDQPRDDAGRFGSGGGSSGSKGSGQTGTFAVKSSTLNDISDDAKVASGDNAGKEMKDYKKAVENSANKVIETASKNVEKMKAMSVDDIEVGVPQMMNTFMRKEWGSTKTDYFTKNSAGQRAITIADREYKDAVRVVTNVVKQMAGK